MTTDLGREEPTVKLKLILTMAILGTALAVPSASSAQVPSEDSVTSNGATVASGAFTIVLIDARSGPSGENPTGQVALTIPRPVPGMGEIPVLGPVACLAVDGNEATIVFEGNFVFLLWQLVVVDNAATGAADTAGVSVVEGVEPDCSGGPVVSQSPVTSGDITVVDVPPLPTTKDQCKNGGWRNFPQFKNEGQCVAFVNHGP